jgi:four helix bundle protein
MQDFIRSYQELQVYQLAFRCTNQLYLLAQHFPDDEKPLLTRQMLSASRSVCTNLAEAWGKRRYRGAFVAKVSDAQSEAAEMQTWIEIAVQCGYLEAETGQELFGHYRTIFSALERLVENATVWVKPLE